ncbi:MAG: hypothetical protein BWZ02_00848 [Lentisphaerae bacterium ADurb.BinA184]|nr:MAG: hypothetical protein BWZ02_00848 [Lentisphaerae bacterium ADurb.BinA184]
MTREARERDEFRTPFSPKALRVVQVTTDPARDSHMDQQNAIRWTPDSKRFLLRREAADNGAAKPGLWLCDTEDGFAIRPVREWANVLPPFTPTAADAEGSLSLAGGQLDPAGDSLFEFYQKGGTLELRRVSLETGKAEPLMTAPAPLSTGWMDVSADGEHVLLSVFLGDGKTEGAPWALRVFDVRNRRQWLVELTNKHRKAGASVYRKGAAFCPGNDHAGVYDILVAVGPARLANGSWLTPPDGSWGPTPSGDATFDFTCVCRDDGGDYPHDGRGPCRVLPLPAPPAYITSHACWRGRSARTFVASMYNVSTTRWRVPFVEVEPAGMEAETVREARAAAPSKWVDLTRFVSRADACHFNFDGSGRHLVSDTDGYVLPQTCMLYVGAYVEPEHGDAPYLETRLLGLARTSWKTQPAHPHPCLSPDGRFAVFQSDFSGRPQVHVAHGFTYP